VDSAYRRGARNAGVSYSQLMHGLKAAGIEIDPQGSGRSRRKGRGRIHAACRQAKQAGAKTKA